MLSVYRDGRPSEEFVGTGSYDQDYMIEMLHFTKSCTTGRHMPPLANGEEGVRNLYAIMKARELARVK
jgi:hypothetical protein